MIRTGTFMCFLLCCTFFANAQSIGPSQLNTSGKSITMSGFTVEQSIGGVVAGNTYVSASLVVTPNVLQPEVVTTTAVNDPRLSAQIITVFPNPTDQVIFIQADFPQKQALDCILTDALGRTIMQHSIVLEKGNNRQEMNLSTLAVGQYNLNIRWKESDKDFSRAFKIQKIK